VTHQIDSIIVYEINDAYMSDILASAPAHHTKHFPVLAYLFNDIPFRLAQRDDGISNGTALWLGAQVLSTYLAVQYRKTSAPGSVRSNAVELGSGIGLLAYVCLPTGMHDNY